MSIPDPFILPCNCGGPSKPTFNPPLPNEPVDWYEPLRANPPPSKLIPVPVLSFLICKQVAPVAEACSFTNSTKFLVDVSELFEPKYKILPVVRLFAPSTIKTEPPVLAG